MIQMLPVDSMAVDFVPSGGGDISAEEGILVEEPGYAGGKAIGVSIFAI